MAAKKSFATEELLLSSFSLDNIPEAVLWIAANGRILKANDKACELSGYTKEELASMHILQLNPTAFLADFDTYWSRLKNEKKLQFESQHRHKAGYVYDVDIQANYIEIDGEGYSCSIVTDVRNKKLEQELLRTVSEATSKHTGDDFFCSSIFASFKVALSLSCVLIRSISEPALAANILRMEV